MTSYEDIARQKLTLNEGRMPDRNRSLEGFIFGLSLIVVVAAVLFFGWFFSAVLLSLE
jgi:hypothetical protein